MLVCQDDIWCWLSELGCDKGSLIIEDFLQVEIVINQVFFGWKLLVEIGLYILVYCLFLEVNVVLYVYIVNVIVLLCIEKSDMLVLQGYEMQKIFSGQYSYFDIVLIVIFDNDQDIDVLVVWIVDYV